METGEQHEVAGRAYQIWEREGRLHGHDLDHWLRAEREIMAKEHSSEQIGGTMRKAPKAARAKKTTPKTSRKAATT